MNRFFLAVVLGMTFINQTLASGPADAEIWAGRIIKARLIESGVLKLVKPNAERFPTVEHILVDLEKSWIGFSVEQKRMLILSTLIYGGAEGGSLELLDRLIGPDSDEALKGLSIESDSLENRLGISREQAVRIDKVLRHLKSLRNRS